MSVVVMGMEMPECCGDCQFQTSRWTGDFCSAGKFMFGIDFDWRDKHPKCPLFPLPEGHGRLIDADAFKAMCLSATKKAKPDFIRHEDWLKTCAITMSFCRDIDEQPTIVPAEGGGEE